MIKMKITNLSTLMDSAAVIRVGLFIAGDDSSLIDSEGKQTINIKEKNNHYTVTDFACSYE